MSLSIADTIAAIPFSVFTEASSSSTVSTITEDYLLVTKHYVDKQVKNVGDKQDFMNNALSAVTEKISEMDNFAAEFKVTVPVNIKPDIASDRATIATITTSKKGPTHIRVDLTDFARKRDPLFYGTPKIDASPNISTAADEDIVTAKFVRNMFASATGTTQPYSSALTSIASLSTIKDQMLYTTGLDTYATTGITQLARDLLSKEKAADIRAGLNLPTYSTSDKLWRCKVQTAQIADTAETANTAKGDDKGLEISTNYLRKDDAYISKTLSTGDIIASYKLGDNTGDIRVDFSGLAPLAGPSFSGKPTAPTAGTNSNDQQIATTAFVKSAIAEITGTGGDSDNPTLGDLYEAIGKNLNFSNDINESLSARQPLSAALTSIAKLNASKDYMLYTSGQNQYDLTPVTKFTRDNILNSNNVTELRSVLFGTSSSVGSSSSVINVTVTNSLSALISNTALSAIISNSAIYDDSGNKISTDYVKIADLHQLKAVGHLNWKSAVTGGSTALSMNSLAYWDGRYKDSRSNLAYCNKGAFGDIVTHSVTDFVSQSSMATVLNEYNSSLSQSYLTSTQISNTYLSMSSASSTFLGKTETAWAAITASTAYSLANSINLSIADADSTNAGVATSFDGSTDVTLKLPSTIKVKLDEGSTASTPLTSDNSSRVATTEYVQNAIAGITAPDTTEGALAATKLSTARNIDGISFDGTAAVSRYAKCTTASSTQIKVVSVNNFKIEEGARITVKFTHTNTIANPKLNVSGTGDYYIKYREKNIPKEALRSGGIYDFIYDSKAWNVVGSLVWTET